MLAGGGAMSWHYEFFAENTEELIKGVEAHAAQQPTSTFLRELSELTKKASAFLTDHEGIGWQIRAFGHVGNYDGFNFTVEVKPINTTRNKFYRAEGR
jgi:hypothetical protein